jgi:hypothetical protein
LSCTQASSSSKGAEIAGEHDLAEQRGLLGFVGLVLADELVVLRLVDNAALLQDREHFLDHRLVRSQRWRRRQPERRAAERCAREFPSHRVPLRRRAASVIPG